VNLPGPTITAEASLGLFQAQVLDVNDMVALSGGGHSVGGAHCSLFQDRINDPAMDRTLNAQLRNTCRAPNDPTAFLDQKTSFLVDNAVYGEIQRQRGILRIDQNLGTSGTTRGIVSSFASNNDLFRQRFVTAMVKMGSLNVLTGRSGEVRRNCRAFNRR
jgi:peroxidase